jgi:uncharacterized protein
VTAATSDSDLSSDPSPPHWPWVAPLLLFLCLGWLQDQLAPAPEAPPGEGAVVAGDPRQPRAPLNDDTPPEAESGREAGLAEPPAEMATDTADGRSALPMFGWFYALRVGLVAAVLVVGAPHVLRQFPWRLTLWGPLVGVLGVGIWIGICELNLEQRWLTWVGWPAADISGRSHFNPFAQGASATVIASVLVVRLLGMVVLVPLIEELFVRGWLIRLLQADRWWQVSLSAISGWRWLVPSLYGMLTHPGELVAAAVWFGLVTWLAKRTGSLWDCVVAHAVTNGLLAIFILQNEAWRYW